MGSNEGTLLLPSGVSNPLKTDWQRHPRLQRYLELGIFDDAPCRDHSLDFQS
jgi:hypothetical protein